MTRTEQVIFDALFGCVGLDMGSTEQTRVVLAALSEAGLAIVPVEPTERMLNGGHAAGVRADNIWRTLDHGPSLRFRQEYLPAAYRAMLTNAQES